VDAHYTDADFCVASAADYLGISEYSTGKLLRNIYGANFRRVINEKRIAYAKMLLMSSDESVGEIGRMSGFMSTSYFIKVFRDSENITPAQFRQIANEN
jgi:AraC-like DNA-binding protein